MKHKVRIPKSYEQYALTMRTMFNENLARDQGLLGTAHLSRGIIEMQTVNGTISSEKISQVFWHEKLHIALKAMNRDDLGADEVFVDNLASLLHQAEVTAVY